MYLFIHKHTSLLSAVRINRFLGMIYKPLGIAAVQIGISQGRFLFQGDL